MLLKKYLSPAAVAGGLMATALSLMPMANAADHQEADGVKANLAADIGDYYAWADGGLLNMIVTFGTFSMPGTPAAFDSTVLYTLHFDTTAPADGVSDMELYARFAQDVSGNWGVQVSGADMTTVEGAVNTVLSEGTTMVWAGLADDPFFFDQSGFNDTVATGTLSFDPTSDDVAGANITAIAIQMPASTIPTGAFQTWATTSAK